MSQWEAQVFNACLEDPPQAKEVYERDLRAAVGWFLDDFEACIEHLCFPL